MNGIPHGEGELQSQDKVFKGTFFNGEKKQG